MRLKMMMVTNVRTARSRAAARCSTFGLEKPTRFTQVGPRGPQPEISRRIHEEINEQNNAEHSRADDGCRH